MCDLRRAEFDGSVCQTLSGPGKPKRRDVLARPAVAVHDLAIAPSGSGLGRSPGIFDLDDLAATVHAAARAHMVWPLHALARLARHQLQRRDEVMSTAVALACAANALFWKCAHDV